MKDISEYTDDEIKSVLMKHISKLSAAAQELDVPKEALARRFAEINLKSADRLNYLYNESTYDTITCPHCGKVAPTVEMDDRSDADLTIYGGRFDSRSLVGDARFGKCCHCNGELKLVYTLHEMRGGPSAAVAEELARRAAEPVSGASSTPTPKKSRRRQRRR